MAAAPTGVDAAFFSVFQLLLKIVDAAKLQNLR